MATLEVVVVLVFFFIFHLPYRATSIQICQNSSCSSTGPIIRFPFFLPTRQPFRCGYPGFDVSCNNRSQTIITLPYGDFVIKRIDYAAQEMWINDLENCLPKRFLGLNNTSYNPFRLWNYTFLNCSSHTKSSTMPMFMPVSCLCGKNYTVVVVLSRYLDGSTFAGCRVIETIVFPRELQASSDLSRDLRFRWVVGDCGSCEERGGFCGFKSDTSLEVGCSLNPPSHGLPRSAKYGIIIGVGIPGLVCMIGLACFICGKIRTYSRRRHPTTELPTSIIPHSNAMLMGLDGPTIESYPKTVLGESGRLPKPNDGTCPICLSDYQPKDTLRTIPECNHYFHADCIDEWLKMNATCPLCRNSPDGSSLITPCSSSPSSSSSSMSSS